MSQGYLVDIPPELKEGYSGPMINVPLSILRQGDPWGVYEAQLRDYFVKKYDDEVKGGMSADDAWNRWILGANKKGDSYQEIINQIDARKSMGMPVNTAPLYIEVQGAIGNNVRELYATHRQKTIDSLQKQVYTARGRTALQEAVKAGHITQVEAFDQNPYYQDYMDTQGQAAASKKEQLQAGAFSQAGRIKLQQAVNRGEISQEDAFNNNPYYQQALQNQEAATVAADQKTVAKEQQSHREAYYQSNELAGNRQGMNSVAGRQALVEAVKNGYLTNDQAFGPGSAWEKWQNETAQAENTKTYRNTAAAETLKRLIGQARESGLDTSMQEATFKEHAYGGGNDMRLAEASQQLGEAINQSKFKAREAQSNLLAARYPDVFKQYQTALPTGNASDFYTWAQGPSEDYPTEVQAAQTAAQKAMRDQEDQALKNYGTGIYNAYQNYLGGLKDANGYKPIDRWVTEDPLRQQAFDEFTKAMTGRNAAAVPRTIYKRRF